MIKRRFSPPQPLVVVTDARERPCALQWHRRTEQIASIEASWEVGTGWWRGEGAGSARRYYRIVTRSGLRAEIYQKVDAGTWYLATVAD